MTMRDHDPDADDLDAGTEGLWAAQERLRKAHAADMPSTATDRALFAALAGESLPALPADFAARTAAVAERLAEARERVARFRAVSLRLFWFLYLPAMAAAALWAGRATFATWSASDPGLRTPLLWAATIAGLWLAVNVIERLRSRADGRQDA
jgi:hypothetical protein